MINQEKAIRCMNALNGRVSPQVNIVELIKTFDIVRIASNNAGDDLGGNEELMDIALADESAMEHLADVIAKNRL